MQLLSKLKSPPTPSGIDDLSRFLAIQFIGLLVKHF
jgi:hypothetical protein